MRHSRIAVIAVLVLAAAAVAQSASLGKYVGPVQTEWLRDGRRMKLLAAFKYVDPDGVEWQAPAGWIVDGASIPQVAWTFAGGPFEGLYRDASVIHDVGCDQKTRPWEAVHEVFYRAMVTSGVAVWRAKIMYAAVYHFGPRWPRRVTVSNVPVTQERTAREEALAKAPPGSTAEIVDVRPRSLSLPEILAHQQQKADFDVRITPPQSILTVAEFEELKQAITTREPTAAGGFSLQEIREYRPPQLP